MVFGVLGVLLVVVVVSYYSFRSSRKKSPNSSAIVCDHTEDTGFYEELDPETLPAYQAVLCSAPQSQDTEIRFVS